MAGAMVANWIRQDYANILKSFFKNNIFKKKQILNVDLSSLVFTKFHSSTAVSLHFNFLFSFFLLKDKGHY